MTQVPSDGAVVAQVLAGDAEAFGVLVERYQDEMTAYANYMTASLDDGADVVQESFVRAFRSLGKCREPERFRAWLFRIVSNQAKSLLSRRTRWPDSSMSTMSMSDTQRESPASDPTPHEAVESEELRRRVRAALQAVSEEQREALVLFYLHDMGIAEVARALGVSEAAVKMRLHRGRTALLSELEGLAP